MVRPIDLQDNLSKTQAAELMNQIQKAHGEMGQRQVADALKEKAQADLGRTKASEKSDMLIIREEQKRERREQTHKGKEDDRKENDDDREPGEESSSHLDLKG
jgi:hypothetical protein